MLSPTHLVMSISRRAPTLGGHAPTPQLGRCPRVEYKPAHQVTAFLQGKRKRPFKCFGSHGLSCFDNLLLLWEDHPLSS